MNEKGFINIFLIIVIVALVGTGIYVVSTKQTPPTVPTPTPILQSNPSQTVTPVSVPKDETVAWKTYTNSEYGFELKLPVYWDGYNAGVRQLTDGSIFVGFNFPYTFNRQKTYYDNALQIIIHPINIWPSIQLSDGSKPPKLGENGKYVYSYAIGQDLGGNSDLEKAKNDMSKILSTFKQVPVVSKNEFIPTTLNVLVANPGSFLNKKVEITGKLILTGKNYYTDPAFALTDGTNKFSVQAWLVLEVPPPMPGSTEKGPERMDDYLDKNITLQGTVKQGEIDRNGQVFYISVIKAL